MEYIIGEKQTKKINAYNFAGQISNDIFTPADRSDDFP